MEAYVRGICEGVEHHLWSSDSRSAYRGIHTLRSSKHVPWCTAVRTEGGGLLTEESEVKTRWADYFERLYQADAPAVELDVNALLRLISIKEPTIPAHSSVKSPVSSALNAVQRGTGLEERNARIPL